MPLKSGHHAQLGSWAAEWGRRGGSTQLTTHTTQCSELATNNKNALLSLCICFFCCTFVKSNAGAGLWGKVVYKGVLWSCCHQPRLICLTPMSSLPPAAVAAIYERDKQVAWQLVYSHYCIITICCSSRFCCCCLLCLYYPLTLFFFFHFLFLIRSLLIVYCIF